MRTAIRPVALTLTCAGLCAATSACQFDDTSTSSCDSTMGSDGAASDGGADAPGEAQPAVDAASDVTVESSAVRPADAAGSDASDAASPGDASTALASVRLANWSSDAPHVDFCLAPQGSATFRGPILAALGASVDAGSGGIPFPQVSAYTLLAGGTYTARVVVGGATDCSVGLPSQTVVLPALPAGGAMTIAVVGKVSPAAGDPPLETVGLLDAVASDSASKIALRFVHAAAGLGAVDFGTAGGSFDVLLSAVPFGSASAASGPDGGTAPANGYLSWSPLTATALSARVHGSGAIAATASSVSAAGGSVLTFALVGDATSPALLECVDNAGTTGLTGDCNVIQ